MGELALSLDRRMSLFMGSEQSSVKLC